MALTKEDILSAEDNQPIRVPTPEWGGDSFVLPCTGDDRDFYDQLQSEKRWPDEDSGRTADWRGLRAGLVARQLCNESGVRMGFTELEVVALGQKNGAVIHRLWAAIRDASGLGSNADEDAEKN